MPRFIHVELAQHDREDVIVDTVRGEVVASVPVRWYLGPLLDLLNAHADAYAEAVGEVYSRYSIAV